jgi:hypothetical protein
MAKIQSFLIPTFTLSLTIAALICPWALPGRPPPLSDAGRLWFEAALASTAAIAIVMLGAVRRRDLIRIANARTVLEGLGRRPLPAGRLIAMAGWSIATLYDELAWGQTLNGCALLIRLASRFGAALAAAAAAVLAIAALTPEAFERLGLGAAVDWRAWLGVATALPIWALAELSLSRREGTSAPTHAEIRAALAGLGDRLGGTGTQLGMAAMTGVEQGLDAVLPLIEQRLHRGAAGGPARDARSDGEELVEELQH